MKMPTSKASFKVSDEIRRGPRCASTKRGALWASGEGWGSGFPAISESREILDFHEVSVDGAEFVPNALDRGSDVCSIPIFTAPRDKSAMVDAVIDRAIAHVIAGVVDQATNDVELGDRQIDVGALPIGPAQARTQGQ